MPARRLPNRLKTYRKGCGLSQSEVARLLGNKNGAQLSRYEKKHRVPPFETALALQVIYKVPLSELFPGLHASIECAVMKRTAQFIQLPEHAAQHDKDTERLRWLDAHQKDLAAQKHSVSCTC